MAKAGRIPNQRPWARSLSGSLLGMTLLALRPCDLTGFNPRQYFRPWLHRRNIFVAVRPKVELLAEFVSGTSNRIAMCLCVPFQLGVKFCLLILRSLVDAFLSSDDLNELAVSNFNVGYRLGFEASRGTFAHPRRFQECTLRTFLRQTNSI